MSAAEWLNLAIAFIPAALWVLKSGNRSETLAKDMAEFRAENRDQAKDLKEEVRSGQKDMLERLEALEERTGEHLNDLDIRAARLEEFRHAVNNRLTILNGHVDELRIRKN